MNNWKHYAGSVLLAGLLLQGCSSAPEDNTPAEASGTTTLEKFNASSGFLTDANLTADAKAQTQVELSIKMAQLDATDTDMQALVKKIMDENGLTKEEALKAIAGAIAGDTAATSPSAARGPNRSVLSGLTDKVKDALVDVMDTSVGNKITNAAFEVVLNSEGVTVFMLDQSRNSNTLAQIMLDAIGANWNLVKKMAPMLRTNKEFGEKFAALAYEYEPMGEFFFANINRTDGGVEKGLMYDALTDAMLLSNDETNIDASVVHSTTGYMGLLMERYAVEFFINPANGVATKYGNTNAFASLMMDTGNVVTVDGNVTTDHGDGMELTNEQFFYAMFVTPTSTDSFVAAMDAVQTNDAATATMFMDNIFMGQGATQTDTVQGYYNIISIAGGMYQGIGTNGFGSYTDAFIGFAGLIPSDRYFTYGSQFMSAGYFWAEQNGIDIWGSVVDGAKGLYADYTAPAAAAPSAARSAGLGTLGSDWISDTLDVVMTAWDGSDLLGYFGSDLGLIEYYNLQALKAYDTVIGSPDSNLTTDISSGETVKGFHGLLELAIQEDIYNTQKDVNTSYTMADAQAAFQLPAFSAITWNYVYTSATDGAAAYYNDVVDAGWLADLSDNTLVREYFYPSADNVYIPSWLMAIDWLKAPQNVTNATIADTDFSFDAGYLDIYVVSANADLINQVNLPQAADPIKTITMEQVNMDSDSIIAVDANGQTLDGLYVYKVRVVSPEDTAAVITYLNGLVDSGLTAIGIDSANAADTAATAE